jgi:hypothetical protein
MRTSPVNDLLHICYPQQRSQSPTTPSETRNYENLNVSSNTNREKKEQFNVQLKSLVNKTNRCTKLQFYWYYYCNVSGSLSAHHQEFLAVQRLWYILCCCDDRLLPAVRWKSKQFHPTPGSKRSSKLHKMYQCRCTAKNS